MNEEEQRVADLDMVKRHCNELVEHFDSVQIFVTRHMPAELGGTRTVSWGAGNWYARYGQVSLWVEEGKERERVAVRKHEE